MSAHLNDRQIVKWLTAVESDESVVPGILRHLQKCDSCRNEASRALGLLQLAGIACHDVDDSRDDAITSANGHASSLDVCPDSLLLTAYAEGAALPERSAVDAHLRRCEVCRMAVEFEDSRLPAEPWSSRLGRFARHNWRFAAAAAIAAIATVGIFVSQFGGSPAHAAYSDETPDFVYQVHWGRVLWARSDEYMEVTLDVIDEGLRQHPNLVQGLLLKANTLLMLNRMSDAKRIAERLITRPELAWPGHALLAGVCQREGDEAGRKVHAEEADRLSPAPSDPAFADSLLFKAVLDGDPHEGIATLNRLLAVYRDKRDALFLRACLHRELAGREDGGGCQHDHAQAMLRDAEQLTRLFPKWSHSWAARAEANRLRGEYAVAVEDCGEAIRIEPSAAVYLIRGECLRRLERPDEALRDFCQVFNLQPSRRQMADAYVSLALALRDQGHYAEAGWELAHVLARHPVGATADVYRCQAVIQLLRSGETSAMRGEAIESLRQALSKDPGNAFAALLFWRLLKEDHQSDEADQVLGAACAGINDKLSSKPRARADRSWPMMLLAYYHGDMSREDLLADAITPSHHCQASYYIGQRVLIDSGEKDAAIWFRRCVSAARRNLDEYHLAKTWLAEHDEALPLGIPSHSTAY